MLEFRQTPRHRVTDVEGIRKLVAKQEPFIVEEKDNPDFRAFAERCTADRIREVWGDREWRVQDFVRERFDPRVAPVENTSLMPFSEFMDRFERSDSGHQSYVNIWPTEGTDFAEDFFAELRAFGKKLPLTAYDDQDLKTIWLGGAGTTTPLHYDTYARSHGTVSGMKRYVFFRPDAKHYRKLGTYSVRSTVGWWSNIGFGPIDDEAYPQLKGTEPWVADCYEGDFVWLPPCWWHYVTIPEGPTITISATHYDRHTYRYWYHWRIRLTRWIGRHEGLQRLLRSKSA